jgi:uncharacterized membrane protein YqjE
MMPSQMFSTLAMVCAMVLGLMLIWSEYTWAAKCAGMWILLYYFYLISSEYENQE